MKTNILTMSVIGMIALLGLGVEPSLASPEPGPYGEMRGHHPQQANHLQHLLKHQKELGLTEEQVKKLKAIELDFDRARIRFDAEIHVNERELQALVEGEEQADLAKVEAKVKQSEILEVALRMSAFKARNEALAVLTPEQRAKGKAAHEKPEPRPGKPEPRP
jgi:protein CpxP